MKKLSNKFKKIVLSFTNPFIVFFIIILLSSRNIYVKRKYIGISLLKRIINNSGFNRFSLTTTGVLILFYDDTVKKFPLSDTSTRSLQKDLSFYHAAANKKIKIFLNYSFSEVKGAYKMSLLFEGKNLFNDYFERLSKINKNYDLYSKKVLSLNDCLYLCPNYKLVESRCRIKFDLKKEVKVMVGFMHGDLTERNILCDINGNCCLIDLDRARFDGILELDEIHYLIELGSKQKGISFFEYIENNTSTLNKKFNSSILYLYLMYRLSNEFRKDTILNDAYYSSAKDCHDYIIALNK